MKIRNLFPSGCLLSMLVLVGCSDKTGETDYQDGVAAFNVRDFVRAERNFNDSLACNPEKADALIYLARISYERGELDAAKSQVEAARAIVGDASDVTLLEAQISWQRKDYSRAAKCFSVLVDDEASSAEIKAEALTGIGIVELTCNRRHQAHVAFLKALRYDRRNSSLQYHLGLLYRDAFGYYESSRERFEFFVRLSELADSRVQRVQLQVIRDLKDLIAQNTASRPGASKRNSSASAAQLAKAEEAWKKGAYTTARQRYQDALSADPISFPAALGLAKAIAKTDATKAGQDKSYANYRLACSLAPTSMSTLLTTGRLAYRRGSYPVAVECYCRAVAVSPNSLDAVDGLIRSLRKTGDSASAAAYQDYRDMLAKKSKKAK